MKNFRGRVWVLIVVALAAAVMGCGSGGDDTAEAEKQPQDTTVAKTSNPTEPKTSGRDALAEYERYLQGEAGLLVKWTGRLEDEIARGEQFTATFKHTVARVHYGHLQPAARLLGPLDSRVNAGFHEIERTLYGKETAAGLKPAARRLVADARRLRRALANMTLQPLPLTRAGRRFLEEVTSRMAKGKEAPYSYKGLVDVAASVEGAEEAFEASRPPLEERDPSLVAQIEKQFAKSFERIDEHGELAREAQGPEAGTAFISFRYMDPIHVRELEEPLAALTDLYGQAIRQLEGS